MALTQLYGLIPPVLFFYALVFKQLMVCNLKNILFSSRKRIVFIPEAYCLQRKTILFER